MTIDEAINFVENMIYLYRPTGEQLEDWNKLLNLLRWYRSQDIIKFEDIEEQAVCEYDSQCPFEHFCNRCEYAVLTMKNIYNISDWNLIKSQLKDSILDECCG